MSFSNLDSKRTLYFAALDAYKSTLLDPSSTQQDIDTAMANVVTAHNDFIPALQTTARDNPGREWGAFFSKPEKFDLGRLNKIAVNMHKRPALSFRGRTVDAIPQNDTELATHSFDSLPIHKVVSTHYLANTIVKKTVA